jgi:membrane protease subunit HflK
MSDRPPSQHDHPLPVVDEFDPANQALADALRKSFRVLRWLMILVVVLYAFSGVFRVKPGEMGYVLRLGRLVQSDLSEGWHWSWPFPIDESRTESLKSDQELACPIRWQQTEQETTGGVRAGGVVRVTPGRDYYLVTGDLNILHANLNVRYKIVDAGDYLEHVYRLTSDPTEKPEHEILRNLVFASAIEIAAGHDLDFVYKNPAFLDQIRDATNDRLAEMATLGAPSGISIVRVESMPIDDFEGIVPPMAVMPEFNSVQTAEQRKNQLIQEARGERDKLLNDVAGARHDELIAAIDAEHAARRTGADNLAQLTAQTESILDGASGRLQRIIAEARARKNKIVSDAQGDAAVVLSLAEEYRRNPKLVMARLRWTRLAQLFDLPTVSRRLIPPDMQQVRLFIKRSAEEQERIMRQIEAFKRSRIESGDVNMSAGETSAGGPTGRRGVAQIPVK